MVHGAPRLGGRPVRLTLELQEGSHTLVTATQPQKRWSTCEDRTHACTHTCIRSHACTHACTCTHTHTRARARTRLSYHALFNNLVEHDNAVGVLFPHHLPEVGRGLPQWALKGGGASLYILTRKLILYFRSGPLSGGSIPMSL